MSTRAVRSASVPRAVELAVFAPIGLAAVVHDRVPQVIRAGRRRAAQRLTIARFVGELVVVEARRRARGAPDSVRPSGAGEDDATDQRGSAPSAPRPPFDDYQQLSAAQVVARLRGLSAAELDAAATFERAHRRRRTVLGGIERLRTGT